MHSTNLPPAGKAISVDTTRPEGVYLTARIVEPTAVKLVKEGVYAAFSVGISKPRIIRDKVAKNGRVVDGVFSEVSVVDFPALPTAKFEVVKRAKDEIEVLEKSLTPVGTLYKKRSEPMADAEVKDDAEVKKAGVECEVCKGSGKDADGADCEKCMGKGVQSEVEKAKVPAIDEEISEELAEADDAIHDAQRAQAADEAGHESDTPEEQVKVPEDEDDEKEAKKSLDVDLSYAVRRLHDATCPAYARSTVESVHPAVAKNGLKAVLDPEIVRSALTAATTSETFDPEIVRNLTDALESAVSIADAPYTEVEMARETLAKGFADAYPTAHVTPGSVSPGQFQRTFLATGRERNMPTGGDSGARIPYVGENTANAEEFDRSALTEGHERPAPASSEIPTAEGSPSAVEQLQAMSRDNAMVAMTILHDRVAAVHPALCALDGSDTGIRSAGFSHSGMEAMDMAGSLRDLKATAAVPTLEKFESTTESDAIVAEVDGGQEVLIDTEVLTSLVKTIMAEQLAAKFDEMQAALDAVQADVQKMASEPDPTQAPVRGTVAVERAVVTKSVSEADVLRDEAERNFTAQVEYLQTLTKSGNPELRMRAQGQLERLLDRAVMAAD